MNQETGRFEKSVRQVGVHLSHNGDFNSMRCYNSSVVVNDVGKWLEKVLNCANTTTGDSPKACGMMDLLRVQGRWAAACRLAYVRAIVTSTNDILEDDSNFPSPMYFQEIGEVFDMNFNMHVNNIIVNTSNIDASVFEVGKVTRHTYMIENGARRQFVNIMVDELRSRRDNGHHLFPWSNDEIVSFVNAAVRGFLYYDLYTAMTEFLSRAEGSFGLQVHSTLEPGVVVMASKGQPMCVAFDPVRSIVLFGSEAEAVAVPVDTHNYWLPERIDLDSRGEVLRVGLPRMFLEGTFRDESCNSPSKRAMKDKKAAIRKKKNSFSGSKLLSYRTSLGRDNLDTSSREEIGATTNALQLSSGIEIRAYSLKSCREASRDDLIARSININCSPVPYDPKKDLVAEDLKVLPAVLTTIDRSWKNPKSVECITADALCKRLVKSMKTRIEAKLDTTDLLITGIEASLWVGEQFACDLRGIFPQLNVVTCSSNKLLGLGMHETASVYFSGSDSVLERRITKETCVLLISQSGQTFPTLHATTRLAKITTERTWILTGCFHSKMELALKEAYAGKGLHYGRNRVLYNYSGNRPAEPSSVAIAATSHTLTRLALHLIKVTRERYPVGRIIQPWEYPQFCMVLKRFLLKCIFRRRHQKDQESIFKLGLREEILDESKLAIPNALINYISNKNKFLGPGRIILKMTDKCIEDVSTLTDRCVVSGLSVAVGYDENLTPITDSNRKVHEALVEKGKVWGQHVQEPWIVLVFTGIYILVSVSLELPIVGVLCDVVRRIAGVTQPLNYSLIWYPLSSGSSSDVYYTIISLAIRVLDALMYIFCVKIFTWLWRLYTGRPLFARMGKRTLVIVDTPCNHQLLEIFVSKLFALSYGFSNVDVHGASGLDHFVHRFTHRVTRGLLLAVGRPDGRLSCLSKSECATLLSIKQAAFIQNTQLGEDGAGPDVVTLGHNSFKPNLPNSAHINLPSKFRNKFVDEVLFESLSSDKLTSKQIAEGLSFAAKMKDERNQPALGTQHISPAVIGTYKFMCVANRSHLNRNSSAVSSDPSDRLAFSSRLDTIASNVVNSQMVVQHFYETRIASLERYISFCVMFHAMAKSSSTPWLCSGWNIARSLSNLRVATTACPNESAEEGADEGEKLTPKLTQQCREFVKKLKGYTYHF